MMNGNEHFSGIGHYIEMLPAVINDTGQFASTSASNSTQQNNQKVAFGEWALIDPEVLPASKSCKNTIGLKPHCIITC